MVAERWFCRAATQLVAVSESQRQSIERYHGLAAGSMMTIPNGVKPVVPPDPRIVARRRAELGFGESDVVVGCVAVLSRQKGVTYLLQAARRIVDQDSRVRLLIVGGGPIEGALRDEARTLRLDSRVVFTGWRNDATSFLPLIDIFVMSSLWEAMPMALLEAMASGRPIVVTDVADNRVIVDNGRCGVLVPPMDASAIAEAVLSLTCRPDYATELGANAARRCQERYTTRNMIEAYERLFERSLH
jgi:glycosyltransferase involved in cell wall biosynthesis